MSPNFAHTIGRITGYLRFVPKFIGRDLIFPVTESSQQLTYLKKLHKKVRIFHLGNSYCSSLLINELIILEINPGMASITGMAGDTLTCTSANHASNISTAVMKTCSPTP